MRSTRSSSRARRSERGYALIAAMVLAVLYFGLVELLLLDSARELAEARRFRARIVAATLAENGAERAALQIVAMSPGAASRTNGEDWQGEYTGHAVRKNDGQFEIDGTGKTSGLVVTEAKVKVLGKVDGNDVRIWYTIHTP